MLVAQHKVDLAEVTAENYETVVSEMDWMADKSPAPKAGQLVATELEQYASNQANTHQLTIKRRAIKPNDEAGVHFHRAKVEFNVTGREDSLYRWLDRLQMPEQFRAVTSMRLSPDAKDDTLIDATVDVEQWYIPQSEDDAATPQARQAHAAGITSALGRPCEGRDPHAVSLLFGRRAALSAFYH